MKFTKIHLDVSELLFMMNASKILVNSSFPLRTGTCASKFLIRLYMEARIRILSDPEFFLASFQFIIITVIAARLLTCFSSAGKNIDINFFITLC